MSTKKVLVDTDIGPDCDDVAALAMMNIYANRGMCEIDVYKRQALRLAGN